jgi:hypothetical protein
MSSFSIDIFDSENSNTSASNFINSSINSSINPSFNHTIGESTNKLNFRTESPSISAPDLLPINNNDERFKQNQVINGKTRYEQDNTIIKSLEEEIVNMKHKLSFVYEKDEEIGKLNEEIKNLKKQLADTVNYSEDLVTLRLENNKLNDEILLLQTTLKEQTLNNESTNNDLIKQLNGKIETLEGELKSNTHITLSKSKVINEGVEDIDDMIDINVPHLREVLTNRLKDKQMDHIESLIETYGLRRTNQVKKSVMEQMLEEAIHI